MNRWLPLVADQCKSAISFRLMSEYPSRLSKLLPKIAIAAAACSDCGNPIRKDPHTPTATEQNREGEKAESLNSFESQPGFRGIF